MKLLSSLLVCVATLGGGAPKKGTSSVPCAGRSSRAASRVVNARSRSAEGNADADIAESGARVPERRGNGGGVGCWAEARVKIARMTLTIKLDRNWSSFQLANSAPPLSVTGSAIAPSARMPPSLLFARPLWRTPFLAVRAVGWGGRGGWAGSGSSEMCEQRRAQRAHRSGTQEL